jgi:hypothetical protein
MEAAIRLTSYGNSGAMKQKRLRVSIVLKLGRQIIYIEFVRKTAEKTEKKWRNNIKKIYRARD